MNDSNDFDFQVNYNKEIYNFQIITKYVFPFNRVQLCELILNKEIKRDLKLNKGRQAEAEAETETEI